MTNEELLSRAAKNFFARSSHLCPEAMVLELHYLRDNLVFLATDCQSFQDLVATQMLLESMIEFVSECAEIKSA